MSNVWRTIRGFILWTHDRGSPHYDVMVTLILCFIFITPHYVNFNDRPVDRTPHPAGGSIRFDKQGALLCEVDGAAIHATDDAGIKDSLRRVCEPLAGEIDILRYEPVRDKKGRLVSYQAWLRR